MWDKIFKQSQLLLMKFKIDFCTGSDCQEKTVDTQTVITNEVNNISSS